MKPRLEDIGIGLMTDSEEKSIDGNIHLFLIRFAFAMYKMCSFNAVLTEESERIVLKQHLMLGVLNTQPASLSMHAGRLADNQVNLFGKSGQDKWPLRKPYRLRRPRQHLTAIKNPSHVARRIYTRTGIFFSSEVRIFGSARSNDHRIGFDRLFAVDVTL